MSDEHKGNEHKEGDTQGLDRRGFLTAGAAGLAVAGLGASSAQAESSKPPGEPPHTNSKDGVRTAIITDTQLNMGPYLAQEFASRGYNLVIADVQKGLEKKLKKEGANKVVVVPGLEQEGPNNEGVPGKIQSIVDAAMAEFGGYDSVFVRTAIHVGDDIFSATADTLQLSYEQNCRAVLFALQAALPPMTKAGGGQVVVQTSASGEKPSAGQAMSYSVMRAAANMMIRCAALSVANENVTVNAIGTNFMNYPGFLELSGAGKDPKVMKAVLDMIPAERLGETREAAHFAMALLDGKNMYTTGNFYPVSGGFNNAGM
jgi:NAD(P)-dependent dehydrogenase (short-subunit alcohol dehydrogenase family)